MTKRRDTDGRRVPPTDTPPDRDAVERAIATVLDRLRPKPVGPAPRPGRAGANRRRRPDGEGA